VKDFIVCGHIDCGAMKALLHPEKLQDLPAVKAWLQLAETTVRIMKDHYGHLKGDELFASTIRENVLVQLDHLRTHPARPDCAVEICACTDESIPSGPARCGSMIPRKKILSSPGRGNEKRNSRVFAMAPGS
jgi:hypothetical protein